VRNFRRGRAPVRVTPYGGRERVDCGEYKMSKSNMTR